jgi:hypothetical protein
MEETVQLKETLVDHTRAVMAEGDTEEEIADLTAEDLLVLQTLAGTTSKLTMDLEEMIPLRQEVMGIPVDMVDVDTIVDVVVDTDLEEEIMVAEDLV